MGDELSSEVIVQLEGLPILYSKVAIVGMNGDLEQGGAAIQPKFGAPMRLMPDDGEAGIPSNAKLAASSGAIGKDNSWSFDHFYTTTLNIPDALKLDEIVLCLAYADGERPIPSCGKGPV